MRSLDFYDPTVEYAEDEDPYDVQNAVYNGDDKIHCLKFGAITDPTGMVEFAGRTHAGPRHDCMVEKYDKVNKRIARAQRGLRKQFVAYGDKAFYRKSHMRAAFKGTRVSRKHCRSNRQMKKMRVSVEWTFGKVTQVVKQIDRYQQHKWKLSQLGKVYIVAMLITNSHTCLYGSQSSKYWNLIPPTLRAYFRVAGNRINV